MNLGAGVVVALLVPFAAGGELRSSAPPLGPSEQYLKPYEAECFEYRTSAAFAGIATVPTDVPLPVARTVIHGIFPSNELVVPVDIKIDAGLSSGSSAIHFSEAVVHDLDQLVSLRSNGLKAENRFTWRMHMAWDKVNVSLSGQMNLLAGKVNLDVNLIFEKASGDMDMVAALNQSKASTALLHKLDVECLLWTAIFGRPDSMPLISGLNTTNASLDFKDFDAEVSITGGVKAIDDLNAAELRQFLLSSKPQLKKIMQDNSWQVRDAANGDVWNSTAAAQSAHCLPFVTKPSEMLSTTAILSIVFSVVLSISLVVFWNLWRRRRAAKAEASIAVLSLSLQPCPPGMVVN